MNTLAMKSEKSKNPNPIMLIFEIAPDPNDNVKRMQNRNSAATINVAAFLRPHPCESPRLATSASEPPSIEVNPAKYTHIINRTLPYSA